MVRSAGSGYRIKAGVLQYEIVHGGNLQHLVLRYTQAVITQAQIAVCSRHHSIDRQLCRWLLLTLDRLCRDEVVTTQALIANMPACVGRL